jgi:hypothetical protein
MDSSVISDRSRHASMSSMVAAAEAVGLQMLHGLTGAVRHFRWLGQPESGRRMRATYLLWAGMLVLPPFAIVVAVSSKICSRVDVLLWMIIEATSSLIPGTTVTKRRHWRVVATSNTLYHSSGSLRWIKRLMTARRVVRDPFSQPPMVRQRLHERPTEPKSRGKVCSVLVRATCRGMCS